MGTLSGLLGLGLSLAGAGLASGAILGASTAWAAFGASGGAARRAAPRG